MILHSHNMLSVEAFHNEALAHQHSTNNLKIKEIKTIYYGKEVTKGPYTMVNTFVKKLSD